MDRGLGGGYSCYQFADNLLSKETESMLFMYTVLVSVKNVIVGNERSKTTTNLPALPAFSSSLTFML